MKLQLRDYQTDAIHAVRGEFKNSKTKPILCLPTGSGKTVIASEIIDRALERGAHRIVFLIDSLTLVEQTIKAFAAQNIACGVIQGQHELTDIGKQVQIATPQTLKRRFAGRHAKIFQTYKVDLVIVDECHVQHTGVIEALEHWGCPAVGLTASPYTKGLGLKYDSVVFPIRMQQLMDQGHLAQYDVFSHKRPSMKGVKSSGGDFQAKAVAELYDEPLRADVIKTWLEKGGGKKTIGFASTVANAEAFSIMFKAAGIASDYTSGYLDSEDAVERLRMFTDVPTEDGGTTVLWNVQKLTKGFDFPGMEVLIDAAPTKSLSLHVQKIGRVLRTAPGKDKALILDHAGNFLRNGFVEDAFIEELCQGSDRSKDQQKPEKLPKECPQCKAIKTAKVCQNCGYEIPPKTQVEVEAGELEKLTKTQAKRNKDMSWEDKAEFMAGFKWHGEMKGWKLGWAANAYKKLTGVWPNDKRVRDVTPSAPTAAVAKYITYLNIRNHHAKKATVNR